MKDLSEMREDYRLQSLSKSEVAKNPIDQFRQWFEDAVRSKILEPNAMVLSTATPEGIPSSRVLLLKEITADGFIFYTNYESHKAQEMEANPYACLNFAWLDLQRQVRIEGNVEKVSRKKSEAYFQGRPRKSQIGAWSSPQSEVIQGRHIIEEQAKLTKQRFEKEVQLPIPDFWGGYKIIPHTIEFWQGRSSRLHDRIRYRLEDKKWIVERLAP